MSGKKVTFSAKPTKANNADAWVENRSIEEEKPPVEKMKRLTIDVPESLHKSIKSACALRGTKIADEVRELLINKYEKE
ncbi:plasmid partition protein ParG [Serratia proteamaculans]|uniref:plasmid partition protein ParG n=1 Tax=Serratia proteamaculans TaxID=28151 RepID=UPI0039BE4624